MLFRSEPLGALDLKLREEMQVELKGIQREVGITFVFVTHDQGEALSMSSRIAVFNHGRIEQVGTPRDIYERPSTEFVAGFVGTANLLSSALSERLLGRPGLHSVRPERLRLAADADSSDLPLDGTVTDIQYLGADCRLRVQLSDGTQLLALVPSGRLEGVTIGGSVRLALPRDAAYSVATSITSEGEDQ